MYLAQRLHFRYAEVIVIDVQGVAEGVEYSRSQECTELQQVFRGFLQCVTRFRHHEIQLLEKIAGRQDYVVPISWYHVVPVNLIVDRLEKLGYETTILK